MAYSPASSTFPTAKTNLESPTATSDTGEFDHAGLESAQNSAIGKLEDIVGITGTDDTASLTYKLTSTSQSNPGHKHTLANGATDVTATAQELNYVDGVTSAIQTQLDAKAPSASPTITGTPVLDATSSIPFYGDFMSRQAIINSNFDVWQRGTSVTLADVTATYLADRWRDYVDKNGGTLPTLTRSRQTEADNDGSYYYSRLTTNGAGTSLGAVSTHSYGQMVEHGTRLLCGLNKKVTVSFFAKSDISNKKLGIFASQLYGTGGTPTAAETITGTNWTLTNTWTKYTFTFTTNTLVGKTFGTANDDYLGIFFSLMWGATNATRVGAAGAETYVGAGNIDIKKVQLCAGDVALPFQPKSFEEELRACQRYYEKSYNYDVAPGTNSSVGSIQQYLASMQNTFILGTYPFKVSKRITGGTTVIYAPDGTVSKYSIGGANKTASAASTQSNVVATQAEVSTNSGNSFWHFTVDAEL